MTTRLHPYDLAVRRGEEPAPARRHQGQAIEAPLRRKFLALAVNKDYALVALEDPERSRRADPAQIYDLRRAALTQQNATMSRTDAFPWTSSAAASRSGAGSNAGPAMSTRPLPFYREYATPGARSKERSGGRGPMRLARTGPEIVIQRLKQRGSLAHSVGQGP